MSHRELIFYFSFQSGFFFFLIDFSRHGLQLQFLFSNVNKIRRALHSLMKIIFFSRVEEADRT